MIREGNHGVLLVNLGSPDSPDSAAVGRYLNEFLMDEHVIDMPRPFRRMLVRGMIVPFRARKSAKAYRSIWWDDGSPLIVTTRRVRDDLQGELDIPVEMAMRYGRPSIEEGLKNLSARCHSGLRHVFAVPLYAHHAMSTVRSIEVAVDSAILKTGIEAQVTFKQPFYGEAPYIEALAESIRPFLKEDYDHILFSYHGLPERHLKKTDPTGKHCLRVKECCSVQSSAHRYCYRHQVLRTTDLVTEALGIPEAKWSNSFQSRLGLDPWLKPSSVEKVGWLAADGVSRLLVVCPAFVSDCLETLEEIGMALKKTFFDAGGRSFELVPCLNQHPLWIQALKGWVTDWRTQIEHSEGEQVAS